MHLEALKLKQKKVFEKLEDFSGFYLAGGTALALQIGHRVSIDFDLFSKKDISINLLRKARQIFKEFDVEIILNHSEQLSVRAGGVKIDFVKYKFPLILRPIQFNGVSIAQAPEIAAMKARTLNYRGTLKDYVDLYFILKDGHSSLEKIRKLARRKYQKEFNFRLFLQQLIYLKDIEEDKLVFLKEKIDKNGLEKYFKQQVAQIKL